MMDELNTLLRIAILELLQASVIVDEKDFATDTRWTGGASKIINCYAYWGGYRNGNQPSFSRTIYLSGKDYETAITELNQVKDDLVKHAKDYRDWKQAKAVQHG